MTMRIFIGGFETETNTFAPWPTGDAGFATQTYEGTASRDCNDTNGMLARLWRGLAADRGLSVTEGLFAFAMPSGPTLEATYQRLSQALVDQIARDGPFDIILLLLHGAMVASITEDCEGDSLQRIRAAAGPSAIIGALLDPHAHLTDRMMEHADVLIAGMRYPHDDYGERGEELFDLCERAAKHAVRPVMRAFDCRMIGFYPTETEPMRGFVEALSQCEREPAILSASLIHGFPWGDVQDVGTKMLVVADADENKAETVAERLGRQFFDLRHALKLDMPGMDEALAHVRETSGLTILADTADNAGGGAPGDNVECLRTLLQQRDISAVYGCLWDPQAVAVCMEAGVGATLDLRIGGKCGPASGSPLDLKATVLALKADHVQTGLEGTILRLGASALISSGNVLIVLASVRTQTFHPDAFTGLGVRFEGQQVVMVKSTTHFRAGFKAVSPHIIAVATPGAIQMNFADIEYRNRRDAPYFPVVDDPFAEMDQADR